ncbi:AraC family transcriptional regulator [Bythopirellula goksoeyrii]|uniref:HTH-type transcriptional regulator ChbR n=1 Tax=Bythopirellula goksoeyrii TaxID=1400387 RepID=A0A5B9QA16_9BACT|nr:AraC family transcriptional regulator [Bythopirellula goksoeyrii]QEG34465.1 HTH-type transcriptional regulator ChbR [Bythopirellula goksoeyrii]
MQPKWTSYRKSDHFEDAVCFPRGCQEQYLAHPGHAKSSLDERGIFLSGISRFVTPYVVQRRNPGYHVVLLSTAGSGELLTDGQKKELKRGDLLIAPSHCEYTYKAKSDWSCVWFHLADETEWSHFLPRKVVLLESRSTDFLSVIANQYLAERQSRLPDSQSALQSLADLIVLLLDRELRQLPQSRKDVDIRKRINQLWQTVHGNLNFPWTTDNLARQAGISPAQFNRVVKRFQKSTPMAVVTNYRMQRAREMLSYTDHTLEAIAASVGYETAFSFSRAFKRHAGKSPNDFRKAMLKD